MNQYSIFHINAFSLESFGGNPAAVIPLEKWLPDDILQKIAAQNNLSETAFFVKEKEGYHIRWMTPLVEVDLCGHATLATAFYLFEIEKIPENKIVFNSRSGKLTVERGAENKLFLDFPVAQLSITDDLSIFNSAGLPKPLEILKASDDYLLLFENQEIVNDLNPDFSQLAKIKARGIIVTAPGNDTDFVCRFFAPAVGINEDPVTGSAFTKLIPYWNKKLNKNKMFAKQISARVGTVWCELKEERVLIAGYGNLYLKGQIHI
jgi:PhzF family phenazine biosynthesis protein